MTYVSRITSTVVGAKIESFTATHNRGYVPNTAEVTVITTKPGFSPFALGTEYTFWAEAATNDPLVGTISSVAFIGYPYQIRWEETSDSTHMRWFVSFVDVFGEIESYDVDIKPSGTGQPEGLWKFYKSTLPEPYASAPIGDFTFHGNGLQGLREFDSYRGYCPYGGDGDELGTLFDHTSGYVRTLSGGDSLPGAYGVKVRATFNNPEAVAEEVSVTYNTGSQQWWIPFAAKNDDDNLVFVLYMTYVKHAQVYVEEGSIEKLYFDDELQLFNVHTQAFYEEKVLDNNLGALGMSFSTDAEPKPFFILPENDNVYMILAIPKLVAVLDPETFEEDTDDLAINIQPVEATASVLMSTFKDSLPDYMTVHILSQSTEQLYEVFVGEDETTADAIDLPQISSLAALGDIAQHEYNERTYNTTTTYEFEHGMVGSIPKAVHFPTASTNHSYNSQDAVLERTDINYGISFGVVVTLTFKEKSASGSTKRVFPGNILYRKIAESYSNAPSIITNIEYCWMDRETGKVKIAWKDNTVTEYSQREIAVGENGVLVWKDPLTQHKERFNYI